MALRRGRVCRGSRAARRCHRAVGPPRRRVEPDAVVRGGTGEQAVGEVGRVGEGAGHRRAVVLAGCTFHIEGRPVGGEADLAVGVDDEDRGGCLVAVAVCVLGGVDVAARHTVAQGGEDAGAVDLAQGAALGEGVGVGID